MTTHGDTRAVQPAVAADGLLGLRSRRPQLNVMYVRTTEPEDRGGIVRDLGSAADAQFGGD